jgi:TolB-like protein/DNA-binding winged helix-turn-helix (wHTH) protein
LGKESQAEHPVPAESTILRIGEWRVDPDLDELSREGQRIRLEPRPMRLLLYLAAHTGRVVDVQELLDEVWPNVVVTQGSVYQAVAQLRRILGDESGHPRYIENLPRRGYRLIAPVAPWHVRSAAADNSSPATQSFTQANGSVGADPQLASGALEAPGTLVVADSTAVPTPGTSVAPPWRAKLAFGVIGAVLAAALAYFAIDKFWIPKQLQIASRGVPATEKATSSTSVTLQAVATTFNPPPHSVAVLPFVNLSGDSKQDYFSDGLTEELLSSLTRINDLQVAAQTSSFYFKGKDADLTTIAHKLNVGAVLEGSVRRSGQRVRVTAQLIDSTTGFHLWSQTFDRNLADVLSLQTEIANAVANALKVTLLGDTAAKIELGGSRNPTAVDAYLRGSKGFSTLHGESDLRSAIDAYSEAIRLDSNYALAFARRSMAVSQYADGMPSGSRRTAYGKAVDDARRAIALAPALGEAHLALARVLLSTLDFSKADQEYARALALAPGNATVLQMYGAFAVFMGRAEPGLSALNRAVVLDPLSPFMHYWLGEARFFARRYSEAVTAFDEVTSLDPEFYRAYGIRGLAYYGLGDLQRALASCETYPRYWTSLLCLALTYEKLGKRADAEAVLAQYRADSGDAPAYQYAGIYAQWGNVTQALEWLEIAVRLRDPGLGWLKTDPLLDPLRLEPRFQAIERALKFPT